MEGREDGGEGRGWREGRTGVRGREREGSWEKLPSPGMRCVIV